MRRRGDQLADITQKSINNPSTQKHELNNTSYTKQNEMRIDQSVSGLVNEIL